ncbi:hypothetical protein PIB30_045995 [Stylosanthes scabra]|uniref:F-box domain-containing protein n=1 Tax=Stylosanthes scabra TaxID=79078 RepID=A0ABU6UJ28_9FABA|nr:hypothetical protein [Stylosanthes scabra]
MEETTTIALPNWLHLPRDVTANILQKAGPEEVFKSAQLVCPQWHNISMDPLMWRTLHIPSRDTSSAVKNKLANICFRAVDRSCGHLQDISIETFGTDSLLNHIANSGNTVERLRLAYCTDITSQALINAANKFPQLEELEISYSYVSSKDSIEAIGQSCPNLKVLKIIMERRKIKDESECNDEALAIAKTMPNLRHLNLLGNHMSIAGLVAILDGCRHLESLDLRGCFGIQYLGGTRLGKRCTEQIKEFQGPDEYLDQSWYLSEETCDDKDDDPYWDMYCDCGLRESSEDEEATAYRIAIEYGLI